MKNDTGIPIIVWVIVYGSAFATLLMDLFVWR